MTLFKDPSSYTCCYFFVFNLAQVKRKELRLCVGANNFYQKQKWNLMLSSVANEPKYFPRLLHWILLCTNLASTSCWTYKLAGLAAPVSDCVQLIGYFISIGEETNISHACTVCPL